MNRTLGSVLVTLTTLAACTVNGKPLLSLPGLSSGPSTGGGPASGPGATSGAAPAATAPASYAWCAGAKQDTPVLDHALGNDRIDNALPAIVTALCFPDDEARAQRGAIEARRQAWMKKLAMTEADWARDVVEWSAIHFGTRNGARVEPRRDAAFSSLDAIDQFARIHVHTGPSDDVGLALGPTYLMDGFGTTQAARLAYLLRCIDGGFESEVHPARWAVCQPDLDAFDAGALGAELRADTKHTALERMVVRIALDRLQTKAVAHAAKVQQLVASDEVYGKAFAIAKGAFADWQRAAPRRAKLLALLAALDDAAVTGSRKAAAGCSERAWPAFSEVIAGLGAKRFEGIAAEPDTGRTFTMQAAGAVLSDPDGWLATAALVACEGKASYVTKQLAGALAQFPGYRGPRSAANAALYHAQLEPDRRGAPAIGAQRGGSPHVLGGGWTDPGQGHARGVVKAVADKGDVLELSFPTKDVVQDPCVSWRTTNRISMIDSSGHVYYEKQCTRRVTERVAVTPKPVSIAKRFAAGIRPGVYVEVTGGAVEGVWTNQRAPRPIAVFGVALK